VEVVQVGQIYHHLIGDKKSMDCAKVALDEIAAHTRDFSHELAAKEQLKFELTYVNMYIKSEST